MRELGKLARIVVKEDCRAVVVDLDGSGYEGRYAESLGYGCLMDQAWQGNFYNVLLGLKGAMKIKFDGVKNGGKEREVGGLEILGKTLGGINCIKKKTVYRQT